MRHAIEMLEAEFDSLKDAYKSAKHNEKQEYSQRMLEVKNAIQVLKNHKS